MKYVLPRILVTLLLLPVSLSSYALNIEGVEVPEQITQPVSNKTLILNGAGVRNKFVFSIYVGALYLTEKHSNVKTILDNEVARRVAMYFLYNEVDRKKLVNAWQEGFEDNNTEAQMQSLQQRLNNFNQLFRTVVRGDVIVLDYVPGKGTSVSINNELQGTVPGHDFNQALLKVWLGDEPADDDLKDAMLGTLQAD
jgi:hypothetical protein